MPPISDEYRKLDRSAPALRRFGFIVGLPLLLIGGFLVWRARGAGWLIAGIGSLILLLALLAPAKLEVVHRVWMTAALAMGWVMTRVILTVVFFLVVVPIGLVQRLFRKRALDLAFRTGASSYWETRASDQPSPADYERQF